MWIRLYRRTVIETVFIASLGRGLEWCFRGMLIRYYEVIVGET